MGTCIFSGCLFPRSLPVVGCTDNLAEGEATSRIAGVGYITICSKSTWGGRISKKRGTRQYTFISGLGWGSGFAGGCHHPLVCFFSRQWSPSVGVITLRKRVWCPRLRDSCDLHTGFLQVWNLMPVFGRTPHTYIGSPDGTLRYLVLPSPAVLQRRLSKTSEHSFLDRVYY